MQEKQSITVRCVDIEDLEKQAEAIRIEQIKLYELYADGVLLRDAYIEMKKKIKVAMLTSHLGVVNRSLKELMKADYLDDSIRPTVKAITEFKQKIPQRAIILAASFGMRMVPINTEMPKGLLEVNGEALIERIIKQLHEVGIKEIYVVVGFMKEKYEYFALKKMNKVPSRLKSVQLDITSTWTYNASK